MAHAMSLCAKMEIRRGVLKSQVGSDVEGTSLTKCSLGSTLLVNLQRMYMFEE